MRGQLQRQFWRSRQRSREGRSLSRPGKQLQPRSSQFRSNRLSDSLPRQCSRRSSEARIPKSSDLYRRGSQSTRQPSQQLTLRSQLRLRLQSKAKAKA